MHGKMAGILFCMLSLSGLQCLARSAQTKTILGELRMQPPTLTALGFD